jgi:alkyl hydroperoxide reductase subunit AhpC
MAESERYLPTLVGRIEAMLEAEGLWDQPITIRMTGCPNGCARPYIAEIGLTGRAPGKYNLYLGGTADGHRLNRLYLENAGEQAILDALRPMIAEYARARTDGERFGDFVIRAGHVSAVTDEFPFNAAAATTPQTNQPNRRTAMSLQLGQIAPDFEQESTEGTIRFHEWLGNSWGVLFSHPKNFTPVCTTELGEVARLKGEWDKRGVKPIGLSVDPLEAHHRWGEDIADTTGYRLNFPMIADQDQKVARLYGMIHPESDPTLTVRAVYVIDPNKKIRLILTYPPSAGRNFAEILRAIDSLQLTDGQKVSTPVNWQPGQPVVISPSLTDEQARERFPQGWKELRPYLRLVQLQD